MSRVIVTWHDARSPEPIIGLSRTGALAAAFLNAAFALCLGCEMYVLVRRVRPDRRALVPANADKEAYR